MNKSSEIVLLATILIPLINCFACSFYQNSSKILNFLITAFPILYLSNLFGLYHATVEDYGSICLIRAYFNLAISFYVGPSTINFLFLLGFIWLVLGFYLRRILALSNRDKFFSTVMLFTILIALINFIILAQNLITALFFFNCLIIWYYFFANNFLPKSLNDAKISSISIASLVLYLQSILLFLAIVITYKISANLEFGQKSAAILVNNENSVYQYLLLFLFYFAGLFLLNLSGLYLLYRNFNFKAIEIFIFFGLGFSLVELFIFYQLLTKVFGLDIFNSLIETFDSQYFYYVFLINMVVSVVLAIFSHNLKSSFFYLFFNQLAATLLTIFVFGGAQNDRVFIIIANFILSQLLIFLNLSNIIIFLKQLQNKEIAGLFYRLKITIMLMIFAFLNIIGVAPAIGIFEKFQLLKTLFNQHSTIGIAIFALNQLLLTIFAIRLFYPMFLTNDHHQEIDETSSIKDIDLNSNLILPPTIVALALILLLFITK